jgi:hypothetical protein
MNFDTLADCVFTLVSARAARYSRCLRNRSDVDIDDLIGEAMSHFVDWYGGECDYFELDSVALSSIADNCLSEAQDVIRSTHSGTRESRAVRHRQVTGDMADTRATIELDSFDRLESARSYLATLLGCDLATIEALTSDTNHTECGALIGTSRKTVQRRRSMLATLVLCDAARLAVSGSFAS